LQLLAHMGITFGATFILDRTYKYIADKSHGSFDSKSNSGDAAAGVIEIKPAPVVEPTTGTLVRFRHKLPIIDIDYRYILLGSILPDLIDKPLGLFILPNLENLRTFAHTFLFLAVILLLAWVVYWKKRSIWGWCLSFGVLMHFILDSIWKDPATLYWPFTGLPFNRYAGMDLESWMHMRFYDLWANPWVFVPEILGLIALISLGIVIIKQGKLRGFIFHGKI
jgi:inner membrane protein